MHVSGRARTAVTMVLAAVAASSLAACTASPAAPGGPIRVVAAENFWGSIAAQLGGDDAAVTRIVDNPNADPHDYEPTARDARAVADAALVIVNGAGYDAWIGKLLDSNPDRHRIVVDASELAGVSPGGNPHLWYSPAAVVATTRAIAAAYARLDPANAARFGDLATTFENVAMRPYTEAIATIRARYAGTPVGASESVVVGMAAALGLRVITPASFLRAISEGTEPSPADKAEIDRQIAARAIAVYVYNPQNATPDVRRQIESARARGIPIATLTETMVPATTTFEAWQTEQLQALAAALAQGTGR